MSLAPKEIAIEAAKSMTLHYRSSFYESKCDGNSESWNVEASHFEQNLTFKIDALTGNVSAKIAKAAYAE